MGTLCIAKVFSMPEEKVDLVKSSHSEARSFFTFERSTGREWVGNLRNVCGSRVQVILEMCTFYSSNYPNF